MAKSFHSLEQAGHIQNRKGPELVLYPGIIWEKDKFMSGSVLKTHKKDTDSCYLGPNPHHFYFLV